MFRDIIAAIPQIVAGDASIVREELVPFFDFSRQFFSESLSSLTSSEEVRVLYSFWTAWVRHNAILPFAIVLMNTLSAFVLFYAFWRLARHATPVRNYAPIVITAAVAFLIHFIMLYAKIAHFYTLVIGFAMFALALSLAIEQLFLRQVGQQRNWRNIIAVSLLVLFNPAIHYHVIFYLVLFVLVVFHLLFGVLLLHQRFWKMFRKDAAYAAWIIGLSLVPYALFILANTSNSLGALSSQIPVNYWMISYTSVALPFVFSFDIVGHIDLYLHGDYLVPSPRIAAMTILFFSGTLFLYRQWGRSSKQLKVLLLTLFVTMLIAIWMAMGYANSELVSFHDVLSSLILFLTTHNIFFGDAIEKLVSVFIGILRFPHRFQFIYFYIGGILFTIALLWLAVALQRIVKKPLISLFIVLLIPLVPFSNPDYRAVLSSGDAHGFLTPYVIPKELSEIKTHLQQNNDDLLFVLPTLESGREITKGDARYSFLDKYLIYYLEQPTMYYGVGGGTSNKILSYLAYRSIDRGEDWWEDILSRNLGITHILFPKHLTNRPDGLTYMETIYPKIRASLEESDNYKKVIEGNDFVLYERQQAPDKTRHVLVDLEWNNFLERFNEQDRTDNEQLYFPLQFNMYFKEERTRQLLTDSLERSFYNLYVGKTKEAFYPQTARLPFTDDLVASSNFTNNALSIDTLNIEDHQYNYLHEKVSTLSTLHTGQFVGISAGSEQEINLILKPKEKGTYRLIIHAAGKHDTLEATLEGQHITLQKIATDRDKAREEMSFTYYYADLELPTGSLQLSVINKSEAVVIEFASLIPQKELPVNFNAINTPLMSITPSEKQDTYEVRMKQ